MPGVKELLRQAEEPLGELISTCTPDWWSLRAIGEASPVVRRLSMVMRSLVVAAALAATPVSAQQVTSSLAAERVLPASAEERAATAEQRVRDLENLEAIARAKEQLADAAYSQFELGMAGLGILITLLVLGFGFITHRGAVNAARHELSDMRDKVQALHGEAVAAKEQAITAASAASEAASAARQALLTAEGAAEGARAHQRSAEEASEKVKEVVALAERWKSAPAEQRQAEMTSDEREAVSVAVREVDEKPEREWTVDEFKVQLFSAEDEERWVDVLRLARGMEFLHGNNEDAIAWALFEQAFALGHLDRGPEAIAVYRNLITRLDNSPSESVQQLLAKALNNVAVLLANEEEWDESIDSCDQVILRFGGREEDYFRSQVGTAYAQKAHALIRSGRTNEAIATLDHALDELGQNFEELDREVFTRILYNKACGWALSRDVPRTTALLDQWGLAAGRFRCESITQDSDFDLIRDDPQFTEYLRRQGCEV